MEVTLITIPARTTKQPLVQPVEPPLSAELQHLNALLKGRCDINITDAGIMLA